MRLLNRRFVPFHFDVFGGRAGDAAAKAAIARQRPELARGAIGVNPILFLTPEGEIVDEIPADRATTSGLLAKLEQVLRAQPDFARASPAEQKITDPIERAELLIDLHRDDEADRLLADVDQPRAHYLRGRLARWRGDFAAMHTHFAKIAKVAELADGVRMESAYETWHERDFEKLAAQLADFPATSPRYPEARYYEGLAHYLAGRTKDARALWKETIKASEQGPWIYRMDWAWADTAANPGARTVLGRIGYFGAYRNPDLQPRR